MLGTCLPAHYCINNVVRPSCVPLSWIPIWACHWTSFLSGFSIFVPAVPSDRNNSRSELMSVWWQPHLYVFWCCCFCICFYIHAGYSLRGHRGHQIFLNCSYKQLFATLWVLGLESWSPERKISLLTPGLSLQPQGSILNYKFSPSSVEALCPNTFSHSSLSWFGIPLFVFLRKFVILLFIITNLTILPERKNKMVIFTF